MLGLIGLNTPEIAGASVIGLLLSLITEKIQAIGIAKKHVNK